MTRPPLVVKRSLPDKPAQPHAADRHDFTPKGKPNPMAVAHFWLGHRLEERPLGYFLDGTPAGLDRIMRETNRLLKAKGREQVSHNEAWRV